jgi:hypothetical protein
LRRLWWLPRLSRLRPQSLSRQPLLRQQLPLPKWWQHLWSRRLRWLLRLNRLRLQPLSRQQQLPKRLLRPWSLPHP